MPFCEYASEVTHECRRGVGAATCGREQALGGSLPEGRLCASLADLGAGHRRLNPFIQFASATPEAGASVVAAVSPWNMPRLTSMHVVIHVQRQYRRRIIYRNGAATHIQRSFRLRCALRSAAATILQRKVRSYGRLSYAALADVTLPSSRTGAEYDAGSTNGVFGGRQCVASLVDLERTRKLNLADLDPSLTLSTSRSPSRSTSLVCSEPDLTFDEEDITGDASDTRTPA